MFKGYKNYKWGFIDNKGKMLFKELVFISANSFVNGLGLIMYNNKWGYVNSNGEWVYKPKDFDLW
jgi:hypothetical protein